jgi:acetolactate synthase regulatory subunit
MTARSSPLILAKVLEAFGLRGARVVSVPLGFEDIERLNVEVAVRGRRPIRNLIEEDADTPGRPVE